MRGNIMKTKIDLKDSLIMEANEKATLAKIMRIVESEDFPNVIEGTAKLQITGKIIDDIKLFRNEFNDDRLFRFICSGGNVTELLERWRQEKIKEFTDKVSNLLYDEIIKRDNSINKRECHMFVLNFMLANSN